MYKVFGVKGACCKMCLVKKLSGVKGYKRCLVYKVFGVKGACCKLCLVKKLSGVKGVGCQRCLMKMCLI